MHACIYTVTQIFIYSRCAYRHCYLTHFVFYLHTYILTYTSTSKFMQFVLFFLFKNNFFVRTSFIHKFTYFFFVVATIYCTCTFLISHLWYGSHSHRHSYQNLIPQSLQFFVTVPLAPLSSFYKELGLYEGCFIKSLEIEKQRFSWSTKRPFCSH